MENSTKALIIAAAVLVAILIITLGLVIFNMASEQVDGAGDLTEYEIQQFNDQFLFYEGEGVSGSNVNAMLRTVFYHNLGQISNSTCVEVVVDDGRENETTIEAINNQEYSPKKVEAREKYNVFCIISKDTKLVTNIIVKMVRPPV